MVDNLARSSGVYDKGAAAQAQAMMPDAMKQHGMDGEKAAKFVFGEVYNPRLKREYGARNAASISASRDEGTGQQQGDDARQEARDFMRNNKVAESVSKMHGLSSAIQKLKENNGVLDNFVLKELISAIENGRVSNEDFEVAKGIRSIWTELYQAWTVHGKGVESLQEKERERLSRAIRTMYRGAISKVKYAREKFGGLRDDWGGKDTPGGKVMQRYINTLPEFEDSKNKKVKAPSAQSGERRSSGRSGTLKGAPAAEAIEEKKKSGGSPLSMIDEVMGGG